MRVWLVSSGGSTVTFVPERLSSESAGRADRSGETSDKRELPAKESSVSRGHCDVFSTSSAPDSQQ